MSVVEIRDKIQTKMEKQPFIEFLFYFGLLPALFIFPINFSINPNIDPVVFEVPYFYLPFGFLSFTLMSLVVSFIGILSVLFFLNSYISASRKFTDSFITNDYVLSKMAKGVYTHLQKLRVNDFTEQIDNAKKGMEHKIDDLHDYWRKKFGIMELKYIRSERRRITSDAALIKERELRKLAMYELKKERELRKELQHKLEKEKSEKLQTIGDKAQSKNNSENTSIKKGNQFDEDL